MELQLIIDQLVAVKALKKLNEQDHKWILCHFAIDSQIDQKLVPVCAGSPIDNNEFDNEFKERFNPQDNRKQ
jgi:hypothetical protein